MLGKRLKILRSEKKITQEELGKVVNVTKVSISGYENGNRTPDTETLQKLADFFNVSTDYLLGRSDEPRPLPNKETEDAEFEAFANNPTLQKWYKELPQSKEEDLEKLRKMWEIIKNDSSN